MSKIKQFVRKTYKRLERNGLFKACYNDYFTADKGDFYKYLTKEQKKQIKDYWGKYFKVTKKDMNVIAFYNHIVGGEFTPKYIPDYYFYADVKTVLNNQAFADSIDNKCYYSMYITHIKRPNEFAKRICGGPLLDNEFVPTTIEEVFNKLDDNQKYIFKPSVLTSGGKDIVTFNKTEIEKMRPIFKKFPDFVVQEFLKQSPALNVFKSKSVNSIRVYSLYMDGEVHILGSSLRIGLHDKEVDNFCSGGVFIPIKENGNLEEFGYTHAKDKISGVNGVEFKDVTIPNYDKVLDLVKKESLKYPQVKFIGWDFAIGEDNEPIFIEFNLTQSDPELLNIITHGEIFRGYEKRILDFAFGKSKKL